MTVMTQEIYEAFLKKGTILSKDKHHLLIGWGKRKWSQKPLDDNKPNFYFPDFFLKIGMPWFSHECWMEIPILEFASYIQDQKTLPEIKWEITKADYFEKAFLGLEESFKTHEIVKAVPYVFESTNVKMTEAQLQSTLKNLIDYTGKYPAFLYGLWDEEEGFLGATPEILFNKSTDSKILETVACAGTYNPQDENLKFCPKLLLEHDIVVQGIEASLKPFGDVYFKPKKSMQFASLMHLITPIKVTLCKEFNFLEIVRALHPTPALGAYPKMSGMLWLEQYQMVIPRGRFGAPAGFYSNSSATCFVAIRNVQWSRKGMKIGAGCGVVCGSNLSQEWQEINLKLKAIKDLLKL
jgi:menaquinone-specific isochorismate synthase